ncbi:hypothetical protein Emag_002975 [Eimeria magna]
MDNAKDSEAKPEKTSDAALGETPPELRETEAVVGTPSPQSVSGASPNSMTDEVQGTCSTTHPEPSVNPGSIGSCGSCQDISFLDALRDNPPALADLVDVNLLSQLTEMGFSEGRAGRALLATKSTPNMEAALAWIESNEDDENLDEPLTAEELAAHKAPAKSPLSEEEAQRLAYELQKRLREERLKREKQEAIEKERLRLQQSKALLEQNAKLEEESRKRAIAQLQKEKEVEALHITNS